jgi:hypothetical protein
MKNSRTVSRGIRSLKYLPGISGIIPVLFIIGIFGCSTVDKTTRKIARDLSPTSGSLKLRMALLPLANKTALKTETLETAFQKPLSLAIRRKCSAVLLETETGFLGFGKMEPLHRKESGQIDAFLLSETGRRQGFNGIAAIRIESVGARVEQRGILWFKGDRHLLQVHADAEVFETLTGTKALSQDFYFETQVDEVIYEQVRSGKETEVPQIRRGLLQIAEEMAGAVCEAVDGLPWRGYVVSVREDTIFISSGKREGLKIGMVLTVFEQGPVVQGIGGQRFILPGKPVGQVKITALDSDTSEARVVSGGPFGEGNSVGID